jgi:hypothetical protein
MKTFFWPLLAFLLLCPFTVAQSQRTTVEKGRRETVQREQLKKLMAKVNVNVPDVDARSDQRATSYRELKVRWTDSPKSTTELRPAATTETQAPSVSIIEDKKLAGILPRQRSLELAPTLMFVAAVDANNKLRWWSIMTDPRVVRAETQTATGELRRQDYLVSNVTLAVAIPDDPEIATLRFYHPVWNGTDFDLKPLTVVPTR